MTDAASTRRAGRRVAADNDKLGTPSRDINDLASFDRDTSGVRAVAGLHFYKELDCLVDLAHGVALDFFDRPQLYRDMTDSIVNALVELRVRYGYQEKFLSRDQRHEIFAGVFGAGEATGGSFPAAAPAAADSFGALRDQLLAAAAAFAERVFNTSEDMLRAAVRIMHVYLKDYLLDVTGASLRWSRKIGLPALAEQRCYRILRDPHIAARFAVNKPPRSEWPFLVDANGSKLVEQISNTPMRRSAEPISRAVFDDKQQLALRGAEALAAVIDYGGETDSGSVDQLITKCYTWYAARGRVLRLPLAVSPPSTMSSAAVASAAIDGNRSLFGTAPNAIPGVIS